jgi:SNF2 family DNA or RNA helicase
MLLGSLEERERMLIDADPGAGKTLIIICDILRNMKKGRVKRPIVVMPESLLGQFAAEVRLFSELNPWIISTKSVGNWQDGELETFLKDAAATPKNTVFLTSYNWLARDYQEMATGDFSKAQDHYKTIKVFTRPELLMSTLSLDGVWMDEVHALKNTSNQSAAASALGKLPVVRGLTGTIMPGNPADVMGPMDVIHSGVFGMQEEFLNRFTLNGTPSAYREDAPKEIRDLLRSFGMRSLRKSAWAHLLPKVHRKYHYVKLSPNQQKAYDAILRNILDEIQNDPKLGKLLAKFQADSDEEELQGMGSLLARFVPLDVFLNSPSASKDWVNALLKETHDAVSPKAKRIAEIAQDHLTKADAGKVLVLVQFKDGAKNILENFPEHLQEIAAYYEGGKIDALARFKDPNDKGVQILVAVDKTLRTGHNLQSANCIIHGDLTWMSGDMTQREGRAVRIGQKRDVYVHQVLASGTAEMLKMARIASAEHLIAKANSDFEDTIMLQPVAMSLSNMTDFRKDEQLSPT